MVMFNSFLLVSQRVTGKYSITINRGFSVVMFHCQYIYHCSSQWISQWLETTGPTQVLGYNWLPEISRYVHVIMSKSSGSLVKACQEVLQLDCNHFYPQLDKHGNPVQISSEDRNESPLFHLECFTLSVESPMCPDLRWVSNFTLCHFIKYWLVQNGFASSWSMIPSGKLT